MSQQTPKSKEEVRNLLIDQNKKHSDLSREELKQIFGGSQEQRAKVHQQ